MAEVTPDRSGHLDDGDRRIWWELFGSGERPVVCLLNGLAMHTGAWHGFLDELRPDHDVLLWDYPGQGRSSCPDEPYLIPELCAHLRSILDVLGIERIHLVGISYGGFVALDFARLHADRLHTLTLSGILLSHERQFEMYQDLSLRFYRAGAVGFELYTHYLYEKIFGEPFLEQLPAATLEQMRRRFHERYRDRVHSLVRLTEAQNPFFDGLDDRLDEYRAIPVPVLILAGEQDRAIPPWAQRKIAGILPHCRYEEIPGAGHVVYLERREVFFPRLRSFVAGAGPGEPSTDTRLP